MVGGRAATVAALLAVAAAGTSVALLGNSTERDRGGSAAPAQLRGLAAELVDRTQALGEGEVAWQTRWRMCWRPLEGATHYLVTVVTSEGVDPTARRTRARCFSLTVASGTAARGDVCDQRNAQLALVEPTLSVSVAARMRDGRLGPASPDLAVGRPYGRAPGACGAAERM